MLSLRTVHPYWRRRIHHNSIRRHSRRRSAHRHEPGVEARSVGVETDRLAWLIKGRLCDGVVCWCELELHHVALGGDDVVGGVGQAAICRTDFDDVDGYGAGGAC